MVEAPSALAGSRPLQAGHNVFDIPLQDRRRLDAARRARERPGAGHNPGTGPVPRSFREPSE